MKVLFQEPIDIEQVNYGIYRGSAGNNTFPYGVACIARHLKDAGHEVAYLDPCIEAMTVERYIDYIRTHEFDVIGIGSTTVQIGNALQTFQILKAHFPHIVTVLGGIHGTLSPVETLTGSDDIDVIMLMEAEKSFLRFLGVLEAEGLEAAKSCAGLAFKRDGEVVVNEYDLSDRLQPEEIPIPLYDIFPMEKYTAQITFAKVFPSYTIIASRGCPFKCTFCNANDVLGRKVRYKPVDRVLEEIRLLRDQYRMKGIMFLDSTLTVNRAWLETFCNEYRKSGIGLPWSCNSRVDTIDADLAKLMKQSGCWNISFGIESGVQKSLDCIRKGTTVEQNRKAVRTALDAGICVYASYILCLPGETREETLASIEFARSLGNHMSLFYLPIPYPKTDLYTTCAETGIVRKDAAWKDYNAWDFRNPVYINPLIGKEEMQRLHKLAYRRFYSNPRVIWNNFKEFALFRQTPYKLYLGLKALLASI